MRKHFLIPAVAMTITAISSTYGATNKIEVHGHRGARARFPENTLPAFQHALEAGADVLELDISVTKDHVLVISHDPVLNTAICQHSDGKRITVPTIIRNLTLNEVRKFDCGSLRNPRFASQTPVPGTKIPTLEEFLTWLEHEKISRAKTVELNIETKSEPEHPEYTPEPHEFSAKLIALLKRHGVFSRSIIQSFDYRTLREARKIDPKTRISALSETAGEDLVRTAKELKANVSSPKWDLLTPDIIQGLHQNKTKVIPWTVNDPTEWDKLISLGVDGMITDNPEALIAYLRTKGLH